MPTFTLAIRRRAKLMLASALVAIAMLIVPVLAPISTIPAGLRTAVAWERCLEVASHGACIGRSAGGVFYFYIF